MEFDGRSVPGAEWVEIVQITNKDGTPLSEENWRHKLFNRICRCWVAGGFRRRSLYFKGHIRLIDGAPLVVNLHSSRRCSTTREQAVEVEPGIFEMETNTSIYRLRILNEEEVRTVSNAVRAALKTEVELRLRQISGENTTFLAADEDGPAS